MVLREPEAGGRPGSSTLKFQSRGHLAPTRGRRTLQQRWVSMLGPRTSRLETPNQGRGSNVPEAPDHGARKVQARNAGLGPAGQGRAGQAERQRPEQGEEVCPGPDAAHSANLGGPALTEDSRAPGRRFTSSSYRLRARRLLSSAPQPLLPPLSPWPPTPTRAANRAEPSRTELCRGFSRALASLAPPPKGGANRTPPLAVPRSKAGRAGHFEAGPRAVGQQEPMGEWRGGGILLSMVWCGWRRTMKAACSGGASRLGTGMVGEARGPGLTVTEHEASSRRGRSMEEARLALECPWKVEPGA